MVKWHAWWFDLLLAVILVVSIAAAVSEPPVAWSPMIGGLVLLLTGYAVVRTRLSRTINAPRGWTDYTGCGAIVAGVAIASYGSSQFSLWLALACPVVWVAVGALIAGIVWNIVMIAASGAAIAVRSAEEGTLPTLWPGLTAGAVLIAVFSLTIGSMVQAAVRWGQERADLLEDLQASQTDLAESYRRLLSDSTAQTALTGESPLSAREAEVLGLASHGCTNREIGLKLHISPATVKTHMEHILTKLGATTRTQAVLMAHQEGYLPNPDPWMP